MKTEELLRIQPRTSEVMNSIIELNLGLAYKQLARFNMSFDNEAISYAFEGLFLAARGFNITHNIKFSTYATCCIYNKICEYLRIRRKETEALPLEEHRYVDSDDTVDLLHTKEIIDKLIKKYKGAQRIILETWVASGYHQLKASKLSGYSQSYVNKVVNEFREALRWQIKN
jgi:RNA polymerase sigma factor (sigma-70 family)